jgi:hypothetical protein
MHFPKCLEPSTEHGSNYILVIYYQSRASKDNFVGLLPERPTKLIVGDIHFGKCMCLHTSGRDKNHDLQHVPHSTIMYA